MSGGVEKFYDDFVQRQINNGVNHRHLSIQRILEEYGLNPNSKILEIGAGIGTQTELTALFLKRDSKIVANDISSKSIEVAKSRLEKFKNIHYVTGDIIDIDLEEKFNCILLPDVLEHIPFETHENLFKKLDNLLLDDGFMLIHIPDPNYLNWVRKNHPEQLQIIDQSLYPSWIHQCCKDTSLYISSFKAYSIYKIPEDYNFYILKKKSTDYSSNSKVPEDGFLRRLNRAIKKIFRK
ncbi:SAM-dependent methyltransferase [Marivirga sp.]|uniref:SAM-dependent methyltransferase n=1 Tax=Marivirga sp. TaxID=2018662 RepID=UPI003DA706E8